MSVGTLHTNVVLAEPGKIHCGSRDPVLGQVSIRYSPSQRNASAELFGPLQVFVVLHGRAKSKIWKSNGQSTSIYRGRAPLFSQSVLIYDDSFRAQPGDTKEFPFSLVFPDVTDAINMGDFEPSSEFVSHPNHPLPPSFQSPPRGFWNNFEAFVEYRVGVRVVMPRLHVDIKGPTEYSEPIVHYERPSAPQPFNRPAYHWRGAASVQNELLLPESDRPSGFRQKTKALFGGGHFPTYAFDWACLASPDIYLGQPVCFEVQIKPRESQCTATLIPEVWLKDFRIRVTAYTQVQSDRGFIGSRRASGDYTVCQMAGTEDNDGPFSKSNGHTKLVKTPALGTGRIDEFPSSFQTYNIAHSYTMKVSFQFILAGKQKHIDKEYAVTVHPPLQSAPPPPAATIGHPQRSNIENFPPELPRYETLPAYESVPATAN
ncbi:hypothetical protein F4802DRAFT_439267 [Xylaria palmicola]|nr:hypothetical protein F4802DRAFT_439267 [Xylaria palmicola]